MSQLRFPTLLAPLALAALAAAQIEPGAAVLASKTPAGLSALTVVSPAGTTQNVTNLDPRTVGTGLDDGLQSIVVDENGLVIAGITTDNRRGTTPQPLELRLIVIQNGVAIVDQSFATLMQVPAGTAWTVTDVQRRHGDGFIVAASEVVQTANPMPQPAAFLVSSNGVVTTLPTAQVPGGILRAIADAGDRWIAGVAQSFFVFNVEITSLPLAPAGQPPFQVHQYVNVPGFGGLGLDADGSILVLAQAGGSPLTRLQHAPNASPSPIGGTPALLDVGTAVPAPGLFAAVELGATSTLHLIDSLAQSSSPWASNLVGLQLDVALRDNPGRYGLAPTTPRLPYLGTHGGRASSGNAAFGLRLGGNAGSSGAVLAAIAPASIPWPFGRILLDLTIPPVVVAATTIPNSGEARTPLAIPANPGLIGNTLYLQGVVFTPGTLVLTSGVAVTVE